MDVPIKTCKVCLSTENKFSPHRYTCTKCRSKASNERSNSLNYYKEYYIKNREALLTYQKELYKSKKLVSN